MHTRGPKARHCRRTGLNLYGSAKYDRVLQRKSQLPGKGARDRRGRLTEYGQQLLEKQKARLIYGVREAQLRRILSDATRSRGRTGVKLLEFLERRLDNVIFRAGMAMTRPQARQFVSHKLFLVNQRPVNVPSLLLRSGDVVEVRPRARDAAVFAGIFAAREKELPPSWLKVDTGTFRIEVLSTPSENDMERSIDAQKIVEFYSR
jgi:small subunit ribosomal protein S4